MLIIMLQKITTTMLIGSSLVHLLCCGLPLLLGLTSIAAWAGWNGAIQRLDIDTLSYTSNGA
jgi:hypothetical protein